MIICLLEYYVFCGVLHNTVYSIWFRNGRQHPHFYIFLFSCFTLIYFIGQHICLYEYHSNGQRKVSTEPFDFSFIRQDAVKVLLIKSLIRAAEPILTPTIYNRSSATCSIIWMQTQTDIIILMGADQIIQIIPQMCTQQFWFVLFYCHFNPSKHFCSILGY